MYVTLKRIRLNGEYVPPGYIVPEGITIPRRMVTTGLVADLPDNLREYTADSESVDTESEDNEQDEEPDDSNEDVSTDEPVPDGSQEDDSDDILSEVSREEHSISENDPDALLEEFHQGSGWYEIPVDGEIKTVRGRGRARAIIESIKDSDD